MPFPTTVDTIVDGPPFGPTTLGHASQVLGPQRITVGPIMYNVKSDQYGAKGDGSTDDRVAIQAALDAARTGGGGIVFLPFGTYICSAALHPQGTFNQCLNVGNNVVLAGAGRGASVIKVAAGGSSTLFNQLHVIMNFQINQAGIPPADTVTFQDFTVDGNGANQNTAIVDRQMGFRLERTRMARHDRIRCQNIFGTTAGPNGPNGTNGEGFGFENELCLDTFYTDCEYIGTLGNARLNVSATGAGGFSTDQGTNVFYVNCIAVGSGQAHGFTHNTTANIRYDNCQAYLNQIRGFNSEAGTDNSHIIQYVNCLAGGNFVAPTGNIQPPWVSNQSLGNGGDGFYVDGSTRCQILGCTSRSNGNDGFKTVNGSGGRIVGGTFSDNGNAGLEWGTTADAQGWRVSGGPLATGNAFQSIVAGTARAIFGNVAPPAVPATGVALTNPFAFDADVYVIPGASTCAITIASTSTGVTLASGGVGTLVRLPAGQSITLTYTAAPSWNWFLD